jgi:TrmH family RNA methyltransferase
MFSNHQLKYYSSLKRKKYRQLEKKFIAEGKRLVEEALKSNFECEIVLMTKKYKDNNSSLITLLEKNKITFSIINKIEFNKISDTKNPQGVAAIVKKNENQDLKIKSKIVVGLENISEPGNLGTILRNCDWFGIKEVILNKNSAELYNPKAIRASMGSLFHLNVLGDVDLYNQITILKSKGYKIICADMTGENFYNYNLPDKILIIFCNETDGPTDKLLSFVDDKITIPKLGNAESLNVASASAVILSELTK